VTDSFQDGRRRHVRNSSENYKMANYDPILTEIGTQTKKKHAELEKHNTGSDHQVRRWPPPPCWKFK
jgi:hypothetical protein